MNPYRNLSNHEMYKLPRSGAVLREIRRRVFIADYRWKQRESFGAKLPHDDSIRDNQFKVIYRREDTNGHLIYEIALNCNIARLALNDWHRVGVKWRGKKGNQAWSYVSYGVTIMHAILVAQMAGMPVVARATFGDPLTRRELGEIKQIGREYVKHHESAPQEIAERID